MIVIQMAGFYAHGKDGHRLPHGPAPERRSLPVGVDDLVGLALRSAPDRRLLAEVQRRGLTVAGRGGARP